MAQIWNTRLAACLAAATMLAGCEEFAALTATPEAQTSAPVQAAARQTQSPAPRVAAAPQPASAQSVPHNDPFTDGASGFDGGFGGSFDSPDTGDDNTSWN